MAAPTINIITVTFSGIATIADRAELIRRVLQAISYRTITHVYSDTVVAKLTITLT